MARRLEIKEMEIHPRKKVTVNDSGGDWTGLESWERSLVASSEGAKKSKTIFLGHKGWAVTSTTFTDGHQVKAGTFLTIYHGPGANLAKVRKVADALAQV